MRHSEVSSGYRRIGDTTGRKFLRGTLVQGPREKTNQKACRFPGTKGNSIEGACIEDNGIDNCRENSGGVRTKREGEKNTCHGWDKVTVCIESP